MFDKLPFNDDFLSDLNSDEESKRIDGIYFIERFEDEIYVLEETTGVSYLVVEKSDQDKLKPYVNGYVYVHGESYLDDSCRIFYIKCKDFMKKLNKHPELNLDFDTIQTMYYLTDKTCERLVDIMVCCENKEKYEGTYISHGYLNILVKWLLRKVHFNRLMKKEDIFENVYMPNGQIMNHDIYSYLNDVESYDNRSIYECAQYLLFVDTSYVKFEKLFYDTFDLFVKKYPNFENEIRQIMNYLFSMSNTNPMNILFKGSNTNSLLMILKEMSQYLDIPYVEFSLSSFGDAGDLSGFNSTYTGSEKGRVAEKVLKYRTTGMVLVLKGLDEINTSSSSHASVLAALYEMLSNRRLNDNYLKYEIDLKNTFIVGTCFDYRNVNSAISNYFYNIKEDNVKSKDLIRNELLDLLNELNLKDVKIDEKVIERIEYIASMDPFNDIYKKYCQLLVNYYGNQIHNTRELDIRLLEEVFDLFEICDDTMKYYFENYDDYNEDIINKFKQCFFELKRNKNSSQHQIQEKLDYLCCCRKTTTSEIDLKKVESALSESHIGLENVKDILLNTLYQYNYDHIEASHLLFYSTHPGVGKTSIAIDACKACEIPVIHINCAQLSNLASLYGDSIHPGLLLSKIKEIGTVQAPIFLDEFEKCDVHIQNSLLNLTDTSNASFYSPYLEVNVPIHCRFMIATANDLSKISEALKDRFRVVEFKPYGFETKLNILKNKILKDLDIQYNSHIEVNEQYLHDYLLNHPFVSIRDMKSDFNYLYTNALRNHTSLMNHRLMSSYQCSKDTINGLGVVGNQGCAFKIECLLYDGVDQLKGNCKKIFKESFDIVLMALRHHGILKHENVFMNIYGNSLEKNGPSAGLAMFACIYGKKKNIDLHDYAFTGELTIHGNVEAVGGIYYKLLACKHAGIHKVVIPFDNYKDYMEISNDLDGMEVYFVKNIHECMGLLENV